MRKMEGMTCSNIVLFTAATCFTSEYGRKWHICDHTSVGSSIEWFEGLHRASGDGAAAAAGFDALSSSVFNLFFARSDSALSVDDILFNVSEEAASSSLGD